MKNAKKLMLLLLSLVLLVGVLTVAAFASEADADVLTVQYPDGTTQTYAEGETVQAYAVPKDFAAMSNGKAYKFTVTDGAAWNYSEALPETVTADDLGKTIVATIDGTMGSEQVFYTTKRSDQADMVYRTKNDLATTLNKSTYPAPNGFTLEIKLYADIETHTFNMGTDSSGNTVLLDLNGYNVTVEGRMSVSYMILYVYSSQPGAHFYSNAGTDGMIFSNDGGAVHLGADKNGNYGDNISFHAEAFFKYMYGNGGYIEGGHYYQTAAADGFIDIARRVHSITNATFYLAPGTKSFLIADPAFSGITNDHRGAATGANAINNCTIYSADANTPALHTTTNATPVFKNCTFYGVTATKTGTNGKVTADATNTFNSKITYKTIAWQDGTTENYYPADLDAAKAYVESSAKYIGVGSVAPYGTLGEDGLYYMVTAPNLSVEYTDLNAVFSDTSDRIRAYYTIELNGETTFNTNASTYQSELKSYFGAMLPDAKVTLWADATMSTIGFKTKHLEDKTVVESATHRLNLNGYNLTITGSAGSIAMDIMCKSLFVYSSRAGAEITANGLILFRTNNDEYKNAAGTTIKPLGNIYIGDSFNNNSGRYANNLTMYCGQVNTEMYGTAAFINGGIFVQTQGSTASYFLLMSRPNADTSHVQHVYNATFITTNPTTSPLYYRSADARTFTRCTFISTNPNGVKLSAFEAVPSNATFSYCNFVNVQQMYSPNGKTFAYNNCKYGTTGLYTTANLAASGTAQYLAHSTNISTITVNGETYVLDGVVIANPAEALLLTRESLGSEFWMIGTSPAAEAADLAKLENGILYKNPFYDYNALSQFENGVVKTAGTATAPVSFSFQDAPAFTYVDTATGKFFGYGVSECGGDAVGIGLKFAEMLNNPTGAYTITMYADMTLTQAITFGASVPFDNGDGYNRDYYNSLAFGSITWDLNGHIVTIDKDCTCVNLNAANNKVGSTAQNGAFFGVIALEGNYANTLTIKSSVAGGKFVNNSTYGLFSVGEGSKPAFDIQGENLTVESKGYIFYGWSPAGGLNHYTINGGTYIFNGTVNDNNLKGLGLLSGIETEVTNATFICMTPVNSVFGFDAYRKNTVTFDNCIFYAPNAAPLFAKAGTYSASYFKDSACTVNNCTIINAMPTEKMIADADYTVTYTGKNVVSSMEALNVMHPEAPAGRTAAYAFVDYNGQTFKVVAYFYSEQTALVDWGFGAQEYWVIGQTATHADAVVDEVFTYAFTPLTVKESDNNATAKIVAIAPGAIQMNLVLQSKIGLNVLFAEGFEGITVRIDGVTYVLGETDAIDGYFVLDKAIAPNLATNAVTVEIVIGDNTHTLSVSVGKYATAILGSADYQDAHNLTYAMVEYVRVMADQADFLASIAAPADYAKETLTAVASANNGTLLEYIAFQLDGTIAIAVKGNAAEIDGMEVTLAIAGRNLTATVAGGEAIFEGLYVNEFIRDFTVAIGEEIYNYNLANYLDGLTNDQYIAGVQALYNYAYHADAYVQALQQN